MIALVLTLALQDAPSTDDASRRARADVAAIQPEINAAIDAGMRFLLSEQLADGSWEHLSELYPSGSTALCVYALLKSGLTVRHPAVRAGLDAMLSMPPRETYSAGVQLLALNATDNDAYRNAMEPILGELLAWREKGGWSYPADQGGDELVPVKGTLDLSNIQYAALGLRAAVLSDYAIDARVWKDLAKTTQTFQTESGGFRYWNEEHNPFAVTGSMTTAGVATLHMAREALGKSPKGADEAIERGLAWLDANLRLASNPSERSDGLGRGGGHYFYYLFGIERVGSFLDRDQLGGKFWYRDGARRLLKAQNSNGSWNDPPTTLEMRPLMRDEGSSELSDTCFALLFLRRASGRTGGQRTADHVYVSEDPDDDVLLRATGKGEVTVWLAGFSDAALARHGRGPVVKGMRVGHVEYLVDGEVKGRVQGDPARAWDASQRMAFRVWLPPGEHRISARVALVPAQAPAGAVHATETLEGAGFGLELSMAGNEFDPLLVGLARRNRIGELKKVETSSGGELSLLAADGVFATRWLSDPGDAQPAITLNLKRPALASELVLCQAARDASERRTVDRARLLAISFNGSKEPLTVEAPDDVLTPIRVPLPEPVRVRTLEIRVLERVEGARSAGRLGFCEVALLHAE